MEENKYIFGGDIFLMTFVFIDKIVYYNNKKLINKFINPQDETKITFNKNPDKIRCLEIYVKLGVVLNTL
jgi:hypothetical protein